MAQIQTLLPNKLACQFALPDARSILPLMPQLIVRTVDGQSCNVGPGGAYARRSDRSKCTRKAARPCGCVSGAKCVPCARSCSCTGCTGKCAVHPLGRRSSSPGTPTPCSPPRRRPRMQPLASFGTAVATTSSSYDTISAT